jgi:hypothetical protein
LLLGCTCWGQAFVVRMVTKPQLGYLLILWLLIIKILTLTCLHCEIGTVTPKPGH